MPDTLKQFYNATIDVTGLTGNQTATLFTNDATTRAVIKDIAVANTFPVVPNLTVAGTPTAALSGNLSGSEIVDVSQAVQVSFPAALQFSQVNIQYLTSSSAGTRTVTSSSRINGVSVKDTAAVLTNPAPTSWNPNGYHYVAADNDVFYVQQNGSNNFILTKTAGGPGGTASNVVNSTYPVAFDGRYYYYLTSTTNLRRFDPETETTTDTTLSSSVPAASTYARMIHSNGYLMYIAANNNNPYIIKISNGIWAFQSGYGSFGPGGVYTGVITSMPSFFIDPVTLVATIYWVDSVNATFKTRSIGPASTNSFTANQTNSTVPFYISKSANSWGPFASTVQQKVTALVDANTALMYYSNNASYIVDITSDTGDWPQTTLLSASTTFDFFFSSSNPTPTVNTTNFPSTISLRVTGVEVTP